MMNLKKIVILGCLIFLHNVTKAENVVDFVDPRIGSEGLGRVFIGPASPFGMVRPGPDCTPSPNSGWLPIPERVDGFSQTHVSGTGGGPKYGNILIQPFSGALDSSIHYAQRDSETISLGYYSTTFAESGIITEITATPRVGVYRFIFPSGSSPALMVDAGFFLGESSIPDAREAQQFVGSEIEITDKNAIKGYSRIRGGWNNGAAYTVYFYLESDQPFVETATFSSKPFSNQPAEISDKKLQTDLGLKTGALVSFSENADTVNVRVGISFISENKAKQNLIEQTANKTFDLLLGENIARWDNALSKIKIAENTSDQIKRMFYTGLYHTMLMPSERTGENPLWNDPGIPYYDDFYAIWDTYRSSSPLLTLIAPDRQRDIVNSLINIGYRDGFMPDARSGNSNGRTQGGSNADIVIADACVKGLKGIDFNEALVEMLKDGEIDPGLRHEAEGRGGLNEYISLGYIPFGIPRAGNRTVEYSLCDFAIAQVASILSSNESNSVRADSLMKLAEKYKKRSHNWINLWRDDATHDGVTGFIMPKNKEGKWLDSIPFGHSSLLKPQYEYYPNIFEGPWYTPWWNMFFYEAPSWEYSLSMPHDVELLIEKCGGHEEFEKRLDIFFDRDYYNVNNEPSFMTPMLYHWIGKPERSSDRIREIINKHFNDSARGLPGNDDSGAMSSWLAWHILGLYPVTPTDTYIIHSPLVESAEILLENGNSFIIKTRNFNDENPHIVDIRLNGRELPLHFLTHADLMEGGELVLTMGRANSSTPANSINPVTSNSDFSCYDKKYKGSPLNVNMAYKLHGQTRKFNMNFHPLDDKGMLLEWNIERNLKLWDGAYLISPQAMESGNRLDYIMPEDGNFIQLDKNALFAMISRQQLQELKMGATEINGVKFILFPDNKEQTKYGFLIEAKDFIEGTHIKILDNDTFPIIMQMENNPLEIDWKYY